MPCSACDAPDANGPLRDSATMDLATFVLVLATAVGAVGLDALLHPRDVVLETVTTGTLERTSIDSSLARSIVEDEVAHVSATPTLMSKPQLRWSNQGGIAAAIAEATRLQSVAYAIQAQFGYQPDEYRIALFSENGQVKVLVTGQSARRGTGFSQVIVQDAGESVVDLIRRATLIGLARVDPYLTALYMLERHGAAGEQEVAAVLAVVLPHFPDSALSPQRAMYENLQGILLLMKQDIPGAQGAFERAAASDPDNVAAALNVAFCDIALKRYDPAGTRMRSLIEGRRPADKVLLATAYVTWAAARMGLGDLDGAEALAVAGTDSNPESATALGLWAELRHRKGDEAGAEQLRARARQSNAAFENYAEIASLYYQLALSDNQKLIRSPYSNPDTVSLP